MSKNEKQGFNMVLENQIIKQSIEMAQKKSMQGYYTDLGDTRKKQSALIGNQQFPPRQDGGFKLNIVNVHNEFNIQNNIINQATPAQQEQFHYLTSDHRMTGSASASHQSPGFQEETKPKYKSKTSKSGSSNLAAGIQKPKRWKLLIQIYYYKMHQENTILREQLLNMTKLLTHSLRSSNAKSLIQDS